jgi:hypothetical protein
MMLLRFPLHVTWSRNGHGLILLVNGQTTAISPKGIEINPIDAKPDNLLTSQFE